MRKDLNKVPSLLFGLKAILLSVFHIPDEFQGWLPFAVAATIRAVRRHKIKHVITSGPPFTAHLIGWAAKMLFGRRLTWIVDFRDPWAGNEQRPELTTSPLSERLNGFLERQVIKHANHVVCVTPAMTESYQKRYPGVSEEKWHTITNGFEREEFDKLENSLPNSKFTISYVGSLEYERSPESLLRVLGALCQEGVIDERHVSVRLVGKCRTIGSRPTTDLIRDFKLENVVELIDAIPRRQALMEMVQSNVLLLLATAQRLQVPGKAYEYLASGRFILAVTESNGATADLLRHAGGAAVVPPDGLDIMRRVLIEQYHLFRYQKTADCFRRADVLAPYEWSELGAEYIRLLEGVDAHRSGEMAHLEKRQLSCPC
jgi:glycosyltransferase involved in cell wall biosynthesis